MTEIRKIYERRFGGDLEFRRAMWKVLCEEFIH